MKQSIKLIYKEAVGSNLFTNAFPVYVLRRGLLFNKFRELVNAVIYSDENTNYRKNNSVLSIGETSGADQISWIFNWYEKVFIMKITGIVKKGEYFDSVSIMLVAKQLIRN